jgi:pimeloyl-ACP methyl ester carboxylesterase
MLHYSITGSGPTLVLLHGFPDNHTIWSGVVPALAAQYTVIVPDLPGAGNSPLAGQMLLSDMADEIAALLRHLGISKAVIAGHSMGGYTALAFARQYPQMVAGISMINSTSKPDDDKKKETRRKVIALIENGGREVFVRQMTPNLFAPTFAANHPQVLSYKLSIALQMQENGIINCYRAMIARPDSAEVLRNAHFPVQWIRGLHDNIVDFRKSLSECQLSPINFVSLYRNSGHMSHLEEPETFVADLLRFSQFCFNRHPEPTC